MGNRDTQGQQDALRNANKAFTQYSNDLNQWRDQYNQYRNQADQRFANDFGGNAADFMQNANRAGIQQANQQLDAGARAATNQAQLASRGAGLSKGQAAMNAAGASNQMFQQNFMPAVQQGTQNFKNAAQMGQNEMQNRMGNSMGLMGQASGGRSNAMGTMAGVGNNQVSDFDRNIGVVSGIGGGLATAGGLFSDERSKNDISKTDWEGDVLKRLMALSDERTKEPIQDDNDLLAEVAEKINNYTYHYKPGLGEDPSVEHSGPMAQELLQVDGYRAAVSEGADGLLQVDAGRLAMVNAGMISDLAKRVIFLENFIQEVMSGLSQPEEMMPDEIFKPDVE